MRDRIGRGKIEPVNFFDFFDPGFGSGPMGGAARRRWPAYSLTKSLDGVCEVTTSEPGGAQRATWTTWAPAAPPAPAREPTLTVYERAGQPAEPTPEFKELVEDLRAKNDPGPILMRQDVRELDE